MPSKHDPAACLEDILSNIDRIEGYITGVDQSTFTANTMLRDAVERCLERVCEAAHRLGDRGLELMPSQPWRNIRGVGNWLRHAYDQINPDVLWNAVCDDLPVLRRDAQVALESLGGITSL